MKDSLKLMLQKKDKQFKKKILSSNIRNRSSNTFKFSADNLPSELNLVYPGLNNNSGPNYQSDVFGNPDNSNRVKNIKNRLFNSKLAAQSRSMVYQSSKRPNSKSLLTQSNVSNPHSCPKVTSKIRSALDLGESNVTNSLVNRIKKKSAQISNMSSLDTSMRSIVGNFSVIYSKVVSQRVPVNHSFSKFKEMKDNKQFSNLKQSKIKGNYYYSKLIYH